MEEQSDRSGGGPRDRRPAGRHWAGGNVLRLIIFAVAAAAVVGGAASCGDKGGTTEAPVTVLPSPQTEETTTPETAVTPETTAPVEPTPEVVACPDDDPDFCAFAVQVAQAIADGDAEFFVANSLTESILCTAEAADVGYFCGPDQVGDTITGVLYGREASEGTLVPPDDYRDLWLRMFASDLPAEEDAEGSGELRIWGLAYPEPPAAGTPRNIVVTHISDTGLGPERQAISLRCELADGQWQIKSLLQHLLSLASPQDTSAEWRDWPE